MISAGPPPLSSLGRRYGHGSFAHQIIKSYEQLADYVRGFVNWQDDLAPYDFGGVIGLLAALLDNIEAHAVDGDFESIKDRLTPEQTATLRRLAEHAHP